MELLGALGRLGPMTWEFEKIPKVAHFYWGRNKPLSLMRYLTVKSFLKLNPDWRVVIFSPKDPEQEVSWGSVHNKQEIYGKDYWEDLLALGGVVESDIKPDSLVPNRLGEVHRSDLFRWWLMSRYQGLWCDMDILFIRSMTVLSNWERKCLECDVLLCRWGHKEEVYPIGFFMAGKGSEGFFAELYRRGVEKANTMMGAFGYESFGFHLLRDLLKEPFGLKIGFIDEDCVYPLRGKDHQLYYKEKGVINFSPCTVGFHWYAGSKFSARLEPLITEDTISQYVSMPLFKKMVEYV